MKRFPVKPLIVAFGGVLLTAALAVALTSAPPNSESRKALWQKVDKSMQEGLPKTAIEQLEPIIAGAMADKKYAEAIKAIGRKIALEGNIQGNKPEEKIVRMQAEIEWAPDEMKPMMEAILAHWYWHYFQQNRWRFMQRTQTDAPPGDDFTTWALPQLFAEIDKHFTAALAAENVLKQTPIADYNDLLAKGNSPDAFRPTLYDFIAHQALEFYSSGEQAAAKAQDAFDLSAESPIFASADNFVAWKVETTDEQSPVVKAIRLYQDLLTFHKADDEPSAALDADLLRLNFGHNKAFGEEKNARYKAALKRFADKWADFPISARALHHLATVVHGEGELVDAHRIATQGVKQFPDSVGGRRCFNLIQQIEAKSIQITTERVWNDPRPTIDIRYRNLTKVYFRVVPYNWEERLSARRQQPEWLDGNERTALLAKRSVLSWSVDLKSTDDFQETVKEIPSPEDLAPGSYYLIASGNQNFSEANNQVSFTDFWKSDLSLIVRTRAGQAELEGFVLEAESGEPISGVAVQSWYNDRTKWTAGPTSKTDKNGLFRFQGVNRHNYVLHVQHGNQSLASGNNYSVYARDLQPRPFMRTAFFTDRSLYRPGQTVQYKGVSFEVDQSRDSYETLNGRTLTVVFADVNNQEIARQQHRTNDYGSFSGSFTAPRDRLMGQMSIRVEGEPQGATAFAVEEYKRPKFQVAVEPPEEAGRLNAEVKVIGKATAYTGAAVDGANVRWRVVREVRYPIWWGWRYWWRAPQVNSQEIAHGSATTGVDGKFDVVFTAKPDAAVSEADEPTFQFTVYADVTDTAGETRSAQRVVNVGYTALAATLSAVDWQTVDAPVAVSIRTATLDGEPQQAEGSLKIYRLEQPNKVARGKLQGRHYGSPYRGGRMTTPSPDPTNPNSWPLGDVVEERGFTTDASGNASYTFNLDAGPYRAILETQDRFGKKVTAELPIQVLDPEAKKLALKIPNLFAAAAWSAQPGDDFSALWGSGYDKARAFVEVEHRGRVVQSYWTRAGRTQQSIRQKVTEAMRGGFTVRTTMVRENRAYLNSRQVSVPWANKTLSVRWEHFVSKLTPAQKETWTAVITGPDANKAVAEMVAGLYDVSLDAYRPHHWQTAFGVFRNDYSNLRSQFENGSRNLQHLYGHWPVANKDGAMSYRTFPGEIIANFWGYQFGRRRVSRGMAPGAPMPMSAPMAEMAMDGAAAEPSMGLQGAYHDAMLAMAKDKNGPAQGQAAAPQPNLDQVSARKNLDETAFFFPHLISNEDGEVKLEFTMPEALTEWRFLGFAHDGDLRAGYLEDRCVTAKDLMIQPNPPRFLREGDVLEFTVKVSNQSPAAQQGQVRLSFSDARTGKNVDVDLSNTTADLAFDVPSKESRTYSWRLSVPDDLGFLTYKAVGSTGRLSDGEEGYLPVLSRRVLVTESLPLPIRGPATREFDFTRLIESGSSDSLKHQSLTVQMVSNPSWYAVMALPYLMEFPHECTEQTFNRLYANALARHIAAADPKIRRIFDQWKGTPALDSPMEKNEDLKAVMLEETPWVRQAQAESQARRNVGILFDDNRLNDETARLSRKMAELQLPDGAWPWFPGGRGNDYITLYITTGFGRMRHLGVDVDVAPALKSLSRLDAWIDETYRRILEHGDKEKYHLSSRIALYLYGRSFFLEDGPVDPKHREAVDYFLGQAKQYWLQLDNRQSQAHLAVALKRFGDLESAQGIMRSIHERSVSNEEMGMFWRELEISWWWYRAPIETQAMIIEAFDEVMDDREAVEDCKVWLLKQKQTQAWKTTKATADAVYALLLRGADVLASDALVEVALAGVAIEPDAVEAGTGFYEKRFAGAEVEPEMGEITVKKVDQGVAWGSVHWQYLEDMTKVTSYEGTPLKLKKALYTKRNTARGPVLEPVDGPVSVGDELVVRIELRVDRDMEYVHLKDYRGSGTEPVNVLSRYKYQDGLAYYESTRDAASHFFIDYLPKGVYVFEYSTRVVHRGEYQTGFAQIQCMYAPEFTSHSESLNLEVK